MISLEKGEPQIEYVHSRMTPDGLEKYELSEFEHRVEVDGEKFSLFVLDFRKVNEAGELATDYPLDFYLMGFMQTDPVHPNELSAAIIERARASGNVLVIPRFEQLPNMPALDAEARLTLAGLNQLAARFLEQGIDFNVAKRDINIIGFSDGARIALELADLIDKIFPERAVTRTLRSLSPTAVIDVIDMPENAQGNEFIKNFVRQVTWITLEETRLRLNAQYEKEVEAINENVHVRMANGTIPTPERRMAEVVAVEKKSIDETGNFEYPLLAKGFDYIDDPAAAYDPRTMQQVVESIARLLSFREGRILFETQLKESMEINIPFLTDVIVRAMTANPKFKAEDFRNGNFLRAITEVFMVYPKLQTHILANETRSPVVDNLRTFDVAAVFPAEDLVFPLEAYGRTISKQIERGFQMSPTYIDSSLGQTLTKALSEKDYTTLGRIFIGNPEIFARVLYPGAKSISIEFTGDFGRLSGTHLAPLKKPENFL